MKELNFSQLSHIYGGHGYESLGYVLSSVSGLLAGMNSQNPKTSKTMSQLIIWSGSAIGTLSGAFDNRWFENETELFIRNAILANGFYLIGLNI